MHSFEIWPSPAGQPGVGTGLVEEKIEKEKN